MLFRSAVNLFGEGPRVPFTVNMKTPVAQLSMNDFSTEDYSGIFSWFGKKAGGGTWVNPIDAGILKDAAGSLGTQMKRAIDRDLSTYPSNSTAAVDFGPDHKVVVTGGWAQYRYNGSMALYGSNDNKTWEQVGSFALNAPAPLEIRYPAWTKPTIPKAYRYIQISVAAEVELYGAIIPAE